MTADSTKADPLTDPLDPDDLFVPTTSYTWPAPATVQGHTFDANSYGATIGYGLAAEYVAEQANLEVEQPGDDTSMLELVDGEDTA